MSGDDAFFLKRLPELPFLSAGRLEANDGTLIAGKIRDGRVTRRSIRHSALEPIGQAMKVQPVTADVYADNAA
ncbi:MAG: hypothetical protein ACK4ZJ_13170, partial [Allorhizobium sp.]